MGRPDDKNMTAKLNSVTFRLKVAQLYNEFLESPMLRDTADDIGMQVVGEIKEFITSRLEFLMGIKVDSTPNAFSLQEVGILKALVAKLISGDEVDVIDPASTTPVDAPKVIGKVKKADKLKKPNKPAEVSKSSNTEEIISLNGKKFVQVRNRSGEPVWRTNPATGEAILNNKGQREPVLSEVPNTAVDAPTQTPQQLAAALEVAAYQSIAAMGLGG